jgi:hypothetical protein
MTDLHVEAQLGEQAKQLLANPIYRKAFDDVRQGILNAWEKAPVRDLEGQQHLKLMLKLLNDLEGNIRQAADTGKLASIQIEQELEKQSRLRNLISGRR